LTFYVIGNNLYVVLFSKTENSTIADFGLLPDNEESGRLSAVDSQTTGTQGYQPPKLFVEGLSEGRDGEFIDKSDIWA
jgi:hypothetical protein